MSRSGMYERIPGCFCPANHLNRDTIKRELAFPADTSITWKSHDESIAQRSQLDESRQQKGTVAPGGSERRRFTLHDEGEKNKVKNSPS